ncbi:MAG: hypothetical protein KA369_16140 [Spirochaetes bacterium]|nr:hypothetical protein [Spirochaetota bacterium]
MKKRRIAIVYLGNTRSESPFRPQFEFIQPSGLHYIHSCVSRDRHPSMIINQVGDNLSNEEVISRINEFEPDIVLFNQFFTTREKIKSITKQLPHRYIVGIGNHDATFHSLSLDKARFYDYYSHIDFAWQGEAENGFREFILTISKRNQPVRINNLHNRITHMDSLPILPHNDYSDEIGFIVTSRGCMINGCEFCTTPQFYQDGWKARSISHVHEELSNLKKSNKKFVMICDDNFFGFSNTDLERGSEIISLCKGLGLQVSLMTTVQQILNAESRGFLSDYTGTLVHVYLGVENGDSGSLIKLGKKCNPEQYPTMAARAIDILMNRNIYPYLGYISFNPETTLSELHSSVQFLYSTIQGSIYYYLSKRLEIYEGTRLFKKYEGIIDKGCFFSDESVAIAHGLFQYIKPFAEKADYLDFELATILSMNQQKDRSLMIEYTAIKKKINRLNYEYCEEIIAISGITGSLPRVFDLVEKYKNSIIKCLKDYISIINNTLTNHDYTVLNKNFLLETVELIQRDSSEINNP